MSAPARPVRRNPGATMLDPSVLEGLSEDEARTATWLASDEMGQMHLLEGWESATVEDKRRLLQQVVAMDEAYPEDAPHKMAEFAARHQMRFPYLIDADQQVAASYGAVCTPDFFGLNGSGQLQYRGRLDNLKMNAEGSRVQELVDAMQLIARTGTGPEAQTPSMGCSIKWKDA